MTQWIVTGLMLLVGVLNLAPAIVFFAPERSLSLYAIDISEPNLGIVMRHRAILLGLLGAALIYGAFRKEFLVPVIIAALIGKAAFLFLVYSSSGANAEIGRVALFDIGAVAVLIVAIALHLFAGK
ncbi:MAG: hypothetical protein KA746_10205 [Pyrinomonadaceae bacterium]|nr:hypothetical protein [Pyrinomonadaceae bacterium]MBP6213026.1 hypothetical protein [Pyrinomonadaceae bacterium]